MNVGLGLGLARSVPAFDGFAVDCFSGEYVQE